MSDMKAFIGKKKDNDLNKLLERINNNQKEILIKLDGKFNIFDSQKRKTKLKKFAMFYSSCISFIDSLKEEDITDEDLNLVKSLYNEQENNKFIAFINSITGKKQSIINKENFQNINNNIINDDNLLKLDKKKKELKSLNSISNKDEKENLTSCFICFEEYNQNEITNPELECKNHIHGKCFSNYIEEELNNNRFPIRCPICQNNQRHEINNKIILDCLLLNDKDDLALKLETISLNYLAINNSEEVSFCPTAGCNYMCFYDKNEYHLNCPLCKKSYCLKCKVEWHKGMTCEENRKARTYDENDQKFDDYVKGNNFKQCPRCKRWVEKISGCNHISCRCGSNFCYNCGQDYNNHDYTKCMNNNVNLFGIQRNPIFGNNILFGDNNQNQNNFNFNNQRNNLYDSNVSDSLSPFSNNNQPQSLFGNNNQPQSLFGNNNQEQNLFGANNQKQNLFGTNNQPYSIFGNNNQSQSIFGNNNKEKKLFGINNQPQRIFGNNNNQPQSIFGNTNQEHNLFGSNNQEHNLFHNNNQTQNLFGKNNQPQSIFGNNNQKQNLFGTNNQPHSIFGNNNQPQSIFGNNNQEHNLFGTNYQPQNIFGNNNQEHNLFSTNNQTQNLFGKNNN